MTRGEWLEWMMKAFGPKEFGFRVTAGCDRCGLYVPNEEGELRCVSISAEKACRKEYDELMKENI